MSWVAFYQANGDQRHTIAVKKFKGAVEQAMADFVARMTHPEVGIWFTWVEEFDERPGDADVHTIHSDVSGSLET